MITHELDVVKEVCDQVAVMNHGKLVEIGNTYDLFTHPKEAFTKEAINYLEERTEDLEVIYSA